MTDEKLPNESRNRISRRTVLKLTGAGAAIAWTTPIISSVRMPAFAASGCQEVFSDNFSGAPCGLTRTSLTGWTITGNVDVVGDVCVGLGEPSYGIASGSAPGPGKWLDLDGTTPPGGATIQTASFGAGSYQVQFDLAGSQRPGSPNVPPNTVDVSFGATLLQSITLADLAPASTYTYTATGPGTLKFVQSGSDLVGLLLSNVVVSYCGP